MDCSDIRNKLSEHIEGNSPPSQQALIEEHLQSCKQCMLYAAELKKTIKTLKGLDEIEPPAWLTAKVMKKIREEASPRKSWIEKLFYPLHVKLPIEALATLLITVAAIFIFKNMGSELQQMEVQSQAPAMKSMPAEQKKEMQRQETKQPQRLREEAKQKNYSSATDTRELTTLKEERPAEQHAPPQVTSPVPAPASSFAPSPGPSSAMRQLEAGKASGMAARDEVIQRYAPATPDSELSAEKKAADLAALTLSVKALDAARREIETYLAKNNGEMKIIEQSESRIILEVKLDPAKTDKFLTHLDSIGKIKEDHRVLSLQSILFKLIIDKQ